MGIPWLGDGTTWKEIGDWRCEEEREKDWTCSGFRCLPGESPETSILIEAWEGGKQTGASRRTGWKARSPSHKLHEPMTKGPKEKKTFLDGKIWAGAAPLSPPTYLIRHRDLLGHGI
jgi:hypothetical protein